MDKTNNETTYRLNVSRDVDTDEPGVFILNLPSGWKFTHDVLSVEHTYAYDTMRELRQDVKTSVVACDCNECTGANFSKAWK